MAATAFVANTNNLLLTGLQSASNGAYLDNAVVTVTIVDAKKNPVSGASFPLTMNYIPGTNGNYSATLIHTLQLLPKHPYTAIINADGNISGSDHWGHWEFPFTAVTRTS